MRNILIVVIASVLVAGFVNATLPSSPEPTVELEQRIDRHFNTIDEAWMWVSNNISYYDDINTVDEYKLPEHTYKERRGDCDDYSMLLAYFIDQIGHDVTLIETNYHSMIRVDGKIIEPQVFGKYPKVAEEDIVREWPYEVMLSASEANYNKYKRFKK